MGLGALGLRPGAMGPGAWGPRPRPAHQAADGEARGAVQARDGDGREHRDSKALPRDARAARAIRVGAREAVDRRDGEHVGREAQAEPPAPGRARGDSGSPARELRPDARQAPSRGEVLPPARNPRARGGDEDVSARGDAAAADRKPRPDRRDVQQHSPHALGRGASDGSGAPHRDSGHASDGGGDAQLELVQD